MHKFANRRNLWEFRFCPRTAPWFFDGIPLFKFPKIDRCWHFSGAVSTNRP